MRIYVALPVAAKLAVNPRTTLVFLHPDNPYIREDRPPCSGGAQERGNFNIGAKKVLLVAQ